MSKSIVCFGEVMMRLATPERLRFTQADRFEATYAGSEANVAVSLAWFGHGTRYVTCLPENDLGKACAMFIARHGVDISRIVWGGNRLGLYFVETGAMQRSSKVIYDRAESALAQAGPGLIDWPAAFENAAWFHWTGITPAVSESAARLCLESVRAAKDRDLTISCDLNYRAKLWQWGRAAGPVMAEMVALTDVLIANEADAGDVFGIKAPETDVTSGEISGQSYKYVAEELMRRFPNLKKVAITLRGSLSADHNTWGALYYDGRDHFLSPTYELTHIVERVGGGDSFAGGLLHGLISFPDQPQKVVDFAVAASALKHSIRGDFNQVSVAEVEKLMGGDASGRVAR